jgi:iron complex outermembrane receptor protein
MLYRAAIALPATLLAATALAQSVPEAAVELPQIQVEGQGERANGSVRGYNATRSATATRTDTPLRDTPISVVVVPRDVIDDQQAISLDEVLRNVPSVQPAGTSGNRGSRYFIRGFRARAYAIDGVGMNPAMDFPMGFNDLVNVERVEVLMGPASVMYGIGDPGGLINIVTRQPQFTPSGYVMGTGSGGDTGSLWRGEFDITGGMGEGTGLAGRMNGSYTATDGTAPGMSRGERLFLSPSVLWQPNDRTRVLISASHIDQTVPFDRGLVAQGNGVIVRRGVYYGETWSQTHTIADDVNLRIEHQANDWLSLRQVSRLDWLQATRTSADPVALAANGQTLTRRATDQDDNAQSIDLLADATARFTTGIVSHAITAGVEYMHGKRSLALSQGSLASIDIVNPVHGARPGTLTLRTVRDDTLGMASGYGQYQATVGGRLILLGGLRYDNYDQERNNNAVTTTSNGDALSPRLGALLHVTDQIALFASWSQSFVPQLGAAYDGTPFDPETGNQYEVGIRADIIPDRLSATISAFNIRRQNVLVTDPLNTGFSIQTGEQRSRGVELSVTGEILPGWRVFAGGAYTDATVTQDTDYPAGRRLPGVPLWSGNFWTTYQFQDGKLEGLMLGGGVFAVSGRTGDLDNTFKVSGYARLDLTASVPVGENARVALSVRNLTDAAYIETPVGRTENYAGAGRTVLASLRLGF